MLAAMPERRIQTLERELLEFAPDPVVGVDERGDIRLANARTEAVFGYGHGELIGQPVETLVPAGLDDGLDLHARRRDGTEFPCEISLSTVETDDGTISLAAIRDITHRRQDRDDLRRAVRRLQAATEVAIAVGGETDLQRVLDAIVERGRSLVEARALIVLLREGDELVVAATAAVAGGLDPKVGQLRFKIEDASQEMLLGRIRAADLGEEEGGRALIAPLLFRNQSLGLVVALDHVGDPGHFDLEHQRMLDAFAVSAASGVSTARSMAEERLQNQIDAAEQERGRWARELHDETLQSLAVLRMRLASALREESPDELHETGQEAVQQIDDEILKLRRLITELRPASLDTIGLEAALYALAQQHQQAGNTIIECEFELSREEERPAALLETAVYRLVQEALNNVSKHSRADRAELVVREFESHIEIEVSDDGVGFDPNLVREGFGLVGMRERAALLGGTLRIESERESGTRVRAEIPLSTAPEDFDG
jgi:signal transduction histidine kinase/PAS domain-containing protein